MNKNIITGVLLVVVFVMGFALIKTNSASQKAAVVSGTKSVSVPAGVNTNVSGAYNSKNQFSLGDITKLPTSPKLECLTGANGSEKGVMVDGQCKSLTSLQSVSVEENANPAAQMICNEWVRVWYWTTVWNMPVYTYYWACADWVMGGTNKPAV